MSRAVHSTLYKVNPEQLQIFCNHSEVLIIYPCILQSAHITSNVQYITNNCVAHT